MFDDTPRNGEWRTAEIELLEHRLGILAREITPDDRRLLQPPEDLWSGIRHAAIDQVPRLQPTRSSSRVKAMATNRWLAAAAAVLVVLVGAVALRPSPPADEVVARAGMSNSDLPVGFAGSGEAALQRRGDDLYLQLDLTALPPQQGDDSYEVWLIDGAVEDMVSVGGVDAGQVMVRIDVPDDVDHRRFPIVDISVEPADGNPDHSGLSVLRGTFDSA